MDSESKVKFVGYASLVGISTRAGRVENWRRVSVIKMEDGRYKAFVKYAGRIVEIIAPCRNLTNLNLIQISVDPPELKNLFEKGWIDLNIFCELVRFFMSEAHILRTRLIESTIGSFVERDFLFFQELREGLVGLLFWLHSTENLPENIVDYFTEKVPKIWSSSVAVD